MYQNIKEIFRQSFFYGIGTSLTRVTGFVLIPVYARYITPSEFGILAIFLLIMSILSILFGMGIHSAFLRFYYDCNDEDEKKRLMGTVILFLLFVSITFSITLLTCEGWLSEFIFNSSQYKYHFRLIIFNVVLDMFFCSFLELFRARNLPIKYVFFSFIKFVFQISTNIAFVVYYKRNFLGVIEGGVLSSFLCLIVIYITLFKSIKFSFSYSKLKEMLQYGLPFIPANLCSLVLTTSDRYLIKIYSDYSEVGLYSMGYKFGLFINIFIVAPFTLAWPTQIINISKKKNAVEIFARVMTYFILISTSFSVVLIVFIKDIYKMLLTPEYFPSHTIVPFIVFSYVFQGIYSVGVLSMFLKKKTKPQLIIFSVAALVNIVLNIVIIPIWGMMGAAITTFISYLIIPLLTYYYSQRLYHVNYEYIRIAKIFIVSFIVIFLSYFGEEATFFNPIVFKISLLLLYPGLLILIGFVKNEELKKAKLLFSQLLQKVY